LVAAHGVARDRFWHDEQHGEREEEKDQRFLRGWAHGEKIIVLIYYFEEERRQRGFI
jgi:hypothetical protein